MSKMILYPLENINTPTEITGKKMFPFEKYLFSKTERDYYILSSDTSFTRSAFGRSYVATTKKISGKMRRKAANLVEFLAFCRYFDFELLLEIPDESPLIFQIKSNFSLPKKNLLKKIYITMTKYYNSYYSVIIIYIGL